MKTKVTLLAVAVTLLALGSPAQAQQDWFFGLSYDTSLPTGDTDVFTPGFSWRGASFQARRATSENTTVGFWTAWHVMDEQSFETLGFELEGFDEGLDLSGDFFRYINSFPIMLNGFYYLGERGGTRPYVGAHAGVYVIERRVDVGLFAADRNRVHFGVAPEAGIVVPIGWQARGFLGARYNWAASSGGSGDITYFNFFVGFAWM